MRIVVLGVGNLILSDEGVGLHALMLLSGYNLPREVELVEGGTEGLGLLPLLKETDFLIVIDAVLAGGEPGSLYRFTPEAMRTGKMPPRLSPHQIGVFDLLETGRFLGFLPETVIWGVQPAVLDWGTELSPPVAGILPQLAGLIVKEIEDARERRSRSI